jgi:hypothetical protein
MNTPDHADAKLLEVLNRHPTLKPHFLRSASRNPLPALSFSAIQDFTRVATS